VGFRVLATGFRCRASTPPPHLYVPSAPPPPPPTERRTPPLRPKRVSRSQPVKPSRRRYLKPFLPSYCERADLLRSIAIDGNLRESERVELWRLGTCDDGVWLVIGAVAVRSAGVGSSPCEAGCVGAKRVSKQPDYLTILLRLYNNIIRFI